MNKLIRTLVALAAIVGGTTVALAQPAIKLVVVDMAKAYDGYYKSEDGNAKLRNEEQKAQQQGEELNKQGQILVDQYKELEEQSKNTMLTAEARGKVEAEAQNKMGEIQQMQARVNEFRATTQRSLQQRAKNLRDLLLEEINKVVTDLAKRKGATLVIDKSGPSLFGIPSVLYSDPAYEMTDEVLKEINKDRPAAAPASATPTPAAKSATPAPASASPAPFTVPNVGTKTEPKTP